MRVRLTVLMVVILLCCGIRPVVYAAGEQPVRLLVGIVEINGDQMMQSILYESIDLGANGVEDDSEALYFGQNHGFGEQDRPITGILDFGSRVLVVSDDAVRSINPGPPQKVRTDEMVGARQLVSTGKTSVVLIGQHFLGTGRVKNGRVRHLDLTAHNEVTFVAATFYQGELYVLAEEKGLRSLFSVPKGASNRYEFTNRQEVLSGLTGVETIVSNDRGVFLLAMSVQTQQLLVTWCTPGDTGLVPVAQLGINLVTSYSLIPGFAVAISDRLYVGRDRQIFSVALSDEGFGETTLYKELPTWFAGSVTALAIRK